MLFEDLFYEGTKTALFCDLLLLVIVLEVTYARLQVGADLAVVRLADDHAELYNCAYVRKTLFCGKVERCVSILVLHVQGCSAVDEHSDNLNVVPLRSVVEGCVPVDTVTVDMKKKITIIIMINNK